MLSTLIPIVKDKLGNLCSSDKYRCIAISSLVLKIFDWVIILLYGDKLRLHDLQFGYQEGCSTNMCTSWQWKLSTILCAMIPMYMCNGYEESHRYSAAFYLKKASA